MAFTHFARAFAAAAVGASFFLLEGCKEESDGQPADSNGGQSADSRLSNRSSVSNTSNNVNIHHLDGQPADWKPIPSQQTEVEKFQCGPLDESFSDGAPSAKAAVENFLKAVKLNVMQWLKVEIPKVRSAEDAANVLVKVTHYLVTALENYINTTDDANLLEKTVKLVQDDPENLGKAIIDTYVPEYVAIKNEISLAKKRLRKKYGESSGKKYRAALEKREHGAFKKLKDRAYARGEQVHNPSGAQWIIDTLQNFFVSL